MDEKCASRPSDERRFARIEVDYYDVLEFIASTRAEYLARLVLPDEISDAKILSVHENPCARNFVFTIEHPSLAPVKPGEAAPLLNARLERKIFRYQAVEPMNHE